MIKGLAITPPAVGRISIGRVVEKNGKRLPEKDDQFTLTTQVQNREGWILHPMDEALRQSAPGSKLRSIPVRMLFDDPALNLRAEYSLFDRSSGRPLCVGNGETCQRLGVDGVEVLSCPSPSLCAFAGAGSGTPQCKPYGRLHVQVDGPEAAGYGADVLDTFVFRTTGFNSIRTLAARLRHGGEGLAWGAVLAQRRYADDRGDNQLLGPDLAWRVDEAWRLRAQWLWSRSTARAGDDGQLHRGSAQDAQRR